MNRMRHRSAPLRGWTVLALLALAACANAPRAPRAAQELTFVVVRHAEKAEAGATDPVLTGAGQARAARLAARLADAPLVAVYSTDLHRTRQTVAPSAGAHGLDVETYDPREPADAFAARLRGAHQAGTVLVAGHSNTVPAIVAALCSCEVAAMPETEFDRISTVRIDADGQARLETGRY